MGKISNYASALKAKLTDFFVVASDNNGVLETKKVTTEQIGDAVASDQVHSSLNTSDKTLTGAINENVSSIGTLSSLTTTDKSSLVGAVNEVNKKESETLTYSSGGNTASFKFSRFGNMVYVGGSGGAMPLPTSWTNLTGTLSANFRPTTALSLALITGDNHLIFLEINTNGTVRIYSNYSGNLYPSGTGIYVTT